MKLKTLISVGLLTAASLFMNLIYAQGLIDGFFNKKGRASFTLSYTSAVYDSFYVADEKVEGVPAHNSIDQSIYNLYATYALADDLSLVASLPYISAKGNGEADPVNGTTEQSDFQDLNLFLKWAPYVSELSNGSLTYFVALGGLVPLGYEPNGILSLGTGAPGVDGKVGLQYKNNSGFFGAFIAGYGLRGKASNNLNGGGPDFDAPNVANGVFKLGYAGGSIYVDAWYDFQYSLDGVDIMGEGFDGNFPETDVDFNRIGANVYVPLTPLIGLSAGFGTTVSGRNIGISTSYSGGLTFNL